MDSLLQKTEQAITAKVPPQIKDAFLRIVAAGGKIMYAPQMRQRMISQLHSPGLNPAQAVGQGIAKLLGLVIAQNKPAFKNPHMLSALAAAGAMLVCEGMDFAEKAGLIQVNEDTLSQATQEMGSALLEVMGVTPQLIQKAQAMKASQQPQPPTQQPQGIINSARGQ